MIWGVTNISERDSTFYADDDGGGGVCYNKIYKSNCYCYCYCDIDRAMNTYYHGVL